MTRCPYCESPATLIICPCCDQALDRAAVLHLTDIALMEEVLETNGLPTLTFATADEFVGYLGWKVQGESV